MGETILATPTRDIGSSIGAACYEVANVRQSLIRWQTAVSDPVPRCKEPPWSYSYFAINKHQHPNASSVLCIFQTRLVSRRSCLISRVAPDHGMRL